MRRWNSEPLAPADIWFHGASVGDMRALAPTVAVVRRVRPDSVLCITAQTATGRTMARRLWPDLRVDAPPIDVPPWPARAVAARRPKLVVLEYLELWPAWIAACRRADVPVVVVDGRVTQRSLRIAWLLRRAAADVTAFCARTHEDAVAAARLGVPRDRIHVHGNAKHDSLSNAPPVPDPDLRAAVGSVDIVVGSLHGDEIGDAVRALANYRGRVLIAPRYPRHAARVVRAAHRHGVSAARRSRGAADARWVVLDTIGELAAAYGLARAAIVGGTFGRRDGQNLIEPAAHGVPVVHGPRVGNVADEARALDGRGAWAVVNWPEAVERAAALVSAGGVDPRPALARLVGASARHLDVILPLLDRATT